jgi:hypothetical protein
LSCRAGAQEDSAVDFNRSPNITRRTIRKQGETERQNCISRPSSRDPSCYLDSAHGKSSSQRTPPSDPEFVQATYNSRTTLQFPKRNSVGPPAVLRRLASRREHEQGRAQKRSELLASPPCGCCGMSGNWRSPPRCPTSYPQGTGSLTVSTRDDGCSLRTNSSWRAEHDAHSQYETSCLAEATTQPGRHSLRGGKMSPTFISSMLTKGLRAGIRQKIIGAASKEPR